MDRRLEASVELLLAPVLEDDRLTRDFIMDGPFPVSVLSLCFFAFPSSTFLHLAAKLREQTVSPRLYTAGDVFTNIITFELPPKESYNQNIN